MFEPAPHEVVETALTSDQRTALLATATAAYARALAPILPAPSAHAAAPVNIMGRIYDRPLTVAMAAFLSASGISLEKDESVLARVFLEEQRHWKRKLGADDDNDPLVDCLHRAATQVTLMQGATRRGGTGPRRSPRRRVWPSCAGSLLGSAANDLRTSRWKDTADRARSARRARGDGRLEG